MRAYYLLIITLLIFTGCATKPEIVEPIPEIKITPENTEVYWKGKPEGPITINLHLQSKILYFVGNEKINGWSNTTNIDFLTTPGVYYKKETVNGLTVFTNDNHTLTISSTNPNANVILPSLGYDILNTFVAKGAKLAAFDDVTSVDISR